MQNVSKEGKNELTKNWVGIYILTQFYFFNPHIPMTIQSQINECIQSIITTRILFAGSAISKEYDIDNNISTAATDGIKLLFNEEFMNNLTFKQRTTLICHELLHILLGHHLRMRGRDVKNWNVACDYVINDILLKMGFEPLPDWLHDTQYSGMSAEDVYAKIQKQSEQQQQQQQQQSNQSGGSFEEPKNSQGKTMSDSELEEAKANAEQEARKAKSQMNRRVKGIKKSESLTEREKASQVKQVGQGFSEYTERLTDYAASRIDWKDVIRNFLFDEAQTEEDDETFDMYAMEAQDFDVVEHDRKSFVFGNILFATDVSGSLSDVAPKIASEAFHCLEQVNRGEMLLYQISDRIHTRKRITDPSEIKTINGGGTNFNSFFNRELVEGEVDAKGIIFVTDGWVNNRSWVEPEIPVLWILTEANTHFENSVPFGDVVRMNS